MQLCHTTTSWSNWQGGMSIAHITTEPLLHTAKDDQMWGAEEQRTSVHSSSYMDTWASWYVELEHRA